MNHHCYNAVVNTIICKNMYMFYRMWKFIVFYMYCNNYYFVKYSICFFNACGLLSTVKGFHLIIVAVLISLQLFGQ